MKQYIIILFLFIFIITFDGSNLNIKRIPILNKQNEVQDIITQEKKVNNEENIKNNNSVSKDVYTNDSKSNKNNLEVNPSNNNNVIKKKEPPKNPKQEEKDNYKCESKTFDFSWFSPDFNTEEECVKIGEQFAYDYSYACTSMKDKCNVTYYMLRLRDREGNYVNYKTLK